MKIYPVLINKNCHSFGIRLLHEESEQRFFTEFLYKKIKENSQKLFFLQKKFIDISKMI